LPNYSYVNFAEDIHLLVGSNYWWSQVGCDMVRNWTRSHLGFDIRAQQRWQFSIINFIAVSIVHIRWPPVRGLRCRLEHNW